MTDNQNSVLFEQDDEYMNIMKSYQVKLDYADRKYISILVEERDLKINQLLKEREEAKIRKLQIAHLEQKHDEQSVKIQSICPSINKLPDNWGWLDELKGRYQFGNKSFIQGGTIRKNLFCEIMNLFERSPHAMSVKTLCELTNLSASRIRIELSGINTRLTKIGYSFQGSNRGYYTLVEIKSQDN